MNDGWLQRLARVEMGLKGFDPIKLQGRMIAAGQSLVEAVQAQDDVLQKYPPRIPRAGVWAFHVTGCAGEPLAGVNVVFVPAPGATASPEATLTDSDGWAYYSQHDSSDEIYQASFFAPDRPLVVATFNSGDLQPTGIVQVEVPMYGDATHACFEGCADIIDLSAKAATVTDQFATRTMAQGHYQPGFPTLNPPTTGPMAYVAQGVAGPLGRSTPDCGTINAGGSNLIYLYCLVGGTGNLVDEGTTVANLGNNLLRLYLNFHCCSGIPGDPLYGIPYLGADIGNTMEFHADAHNVVCNSAGVWQADFDFSFLPDLFESNPLVRVKFS